MGEKIVGQGEENAGFNASEQKAGFNQKLRAMKDRRIEDLQALLPQRKSHWQNGITTRRA